MKVDQKDWKPIDLRSYQGLEAAKLIHSYYDDQTSYETYKVLFEAVTKVNHWNDREKAAALELALREPALDLLHKLLVDDRRITTS